MDQAALDNRPLVHFDALVVHIAFDPGTGLQFEGFRGMDRTVLALMAEKARALGKPEATRLVAEACIELAGGRA